MCQEVKDFSNHTFHLVYIWYTDSYERCCSSKIISSTNQWIFNKLDMCIDIEKEEIWLGIANGQISSMFDELSAYHTSIFLFLNDNSSKCQWIFTKLGIDIVEIWFGTTNRLISSVFDSYLPTIFQYFHFPTMTITCKYQWIFTKLSTCIDIVEIWFRIANGQITSTSDRVICPPHNVRVLSFHIFIVS